MVIDASEAAEIVITRQMIVRVAQTLRESGALAHPVIGLSALAERVLRIGLRGHQCGNTGSSIEQTPSKTAIELDRCL